MSNDELVWVEWLRDRPRRDPRVTLGIGDDMAIVTSPSPSLLICSDMLLDGVHFDTTRHSPRQIGRKAMACSLSDCAAMAVQPVAATVSFAFPSDFPLSQSKELFEGLSAMADEYEVAIVGGDTTRWSHPLAIDVAITAQCFEETDERSPAKAGASRLLQPVTRLGAMVGDALYVTGPLGGSSLGGHLIFEPRVRQARILAQQLGDRLHAMIDISDGLSLDVWRICRASNVGATLDASALQSVISDDARRAAAEDGRDPLDHALHDGEDYELLLAVEGDLAELSVPLLRVGEVVETGLHMRQADGREERIEPKGYVH